MLCLESTNVRTIAAILERFTTQIHNTLFSNQTKQTENIKKNFETFKAPSSGLEDKGEKSHMKLALLTLVFSYLRV
jgi:hypothetical protein